MIRSPELKEATLRLWSEDADTRLKAADRLGRMVAEMVDIRSAQPALTLLLKDPVSQVAKAALRTVQLRARQGADIGMAVPSLASLLDASDEEMVEMARSALQYADMRLTGISDIVEMHVAAVADDDSRSRWGTEPWASATAARFFAGLFAGVDIDREIEAALTREDKDLDAIRAVAYLLQVFGMPRVWPGNGEKLASHLTRTIAMLTALLSADTGDSHLGSSAKSRHDPDLMASVEQQVAELRQKVL